MDGVTTHVSDRCGPLERTDVFIGCCVDHAEGHDERRRVPLLSHYLHVIPVSMILKCSGATKITDFSNTSEIALEQFQNCSRAAQSHRLSEENCAGFPKVHGDEMREAAADATPPAFSVARRVFRPFRFRLLLGWLHCDGVAFLEDRIIGFGGAVTCDLGHGVFLSHIFLS